MKKYIVMLLSLCMIFCLSLPVCAEEASSSDAASSGASSEVPADSDIDGGELSGSMEDSSETILDAMANIQDDVNASLEGFSGVSIFMGNTVGAVINCMPVFFKVYLLLLAIVLVVVAIIRVINK